MKRFFVHLFFFLLLTKLVFAEDDFSEANKLFYIGQMNSYNKDFTLYFKTREKAVLARGENFNYITDYPQDLYIYYYKTKTSLPLITYEWFPSKAKYFLEEYNFPVFPEDFAYYLLKDNNTIVMVSALKNIKINFSFDIAQKKLKTYPTNGNFEFIISSIIKNCGHSNLDENYKCNFYKPLISNNLIN